ncbi:SAF domain-containing protein [Glycomyces sp. MUSA5-2]|uniref:SAF domain-containing protein n=1 Tax=Glycomyces sp. MUSA5-2 TaxID=2053002 RepID=UPI00300AED68
MALVVLCIAAAYQYTAGADDRQTVLITATALQAGQTITEADLAQTAIDPGDLVVVDAADMGSLVGRTAALPVAAGTVLTPSMIGAAAVPGPGRAEATLALADGAFPAGLAAGASVVVVALLEGVPDPWQLAAVVRHVELVDGGAEVGIEFDAVDTGGLARARLADPVLISVGPVVEAGE